MVTPDDKELYEAELEIEELAMQLADMLAVALYYAGLKETKLQEASEAYLDSMESVMTQNGEDGEYDFREVIKVIEHVKKNRPELFEKGIVQSFDKIKGDREPFSE